jgi:hypothetical protein
VKAVIGADKLSSACDRRGGNMPKPEHDLLPSNHAAADVRGCRIITEYMA